MNSDYYKKLLDNNCITLINKSVNDLDVIRITDELYTNIIFNIKNFLKMNEGTEILINEIYNNIMTINKNKEINIIPITIQVPDYRTPFLCGMQKYSNYSLIELVDKLYSKNHKKNLSIKDIEEIYKDCEIIIFSANYIGEIENYILSINEKENVSIKAIILILGISDPIKKFISSNYPDDINNIPIKEIIPINEIIKDKSIMDKILKES